jgi:phosphonate transport system permease protein
VTPGATPAARALAPPVPKLARAVHSVGMLGRLSSEVIEDMDMDPVEALTLVSGAERVWAYLGSRVN